MNRGVVIPLRERGVLWLMIAGSLVVHASAFFLFRVSDAMDLPFFAERSHVRMMSRSLERGGKMHVQYVMASLLDPALIAMPSARGFSGKMWNRGLPASRHSHEWNSEPSYLAPPKPAEFPSLLAQSPLPNVVQSAAAKALEASEETSPATRGLPPTLDKSVFRLLGALSDRAVMKSPALPRIPSPVALRPTMVRVGVGADGAVRYASLERTCGNEQVDGQALDWARQIRFEPSAPDGSEELMWGVVRFFWATELPGGAP